IAYGRATNAVEAMTHYAAAKIANAMTNDPTIGVSSVSLTPPASLLAFMQGAGVQWLELKAGPVSASTGKYVSNQSATASHDNKRGMFYFTQTVDLFAKASGKIGNGPATLT